MFNKHSYICLAIAFCFGWAVISISIGQDGASWMPLLLASVSFATLLIKRKKKSKVDKVDELEISDIGLVRKIARLGLETQESVRWNEVEKIAIETTDGGPFVEDFFIILFGAGESGVVVPNGLACRYELLPELQTRFPGLDNEVVIKASGCTENRLFTIWQRPVFLNPTIS